MSRHYEFDAIGTHWWLEILSEQSFTPALIKQLTKTHQKFDKNYSRFRDDSLVAELFRTGRLTHPPAEMIEMLAFAKELHTVSRGAFDITVGNTLHRLGYGKRDKARDVDTTDFWQTITISPQEIQLKQPLMLDFGGFGKGWLIDLFVRDLRQAGITEFIVNGGGDLYVQSETPIEFALENPYDPSRKIGQTRIMRGALAGSNTIKRIWQDGDKTKHHIINPLSGDSSRTDVVASYVRASTALIADTMATILILRPDLEQALQKQYDLQTILLRNDQ